MVQASTINGTSEIFSYFIIKITVMTNWERRVSTSIHWKNLLQYFFQGLIIIAPLGITLYAVLWVFNTIDSILPNILNYLFPNIIEPVHIPGLGFILAVLLVLLIGKLSSSFFLGRFVELIDGVLERT